MPNFDFSSVTKIQWLFAIFFFACFLSASIIHLVFCYNEAEKQRKISKCFCISFLALAVLSFKPNEWLIYTALFLGTLGDLCLIWKNDKRQLAFGSLFFFLGHVCYIVRLAMFSDPNMGGYRWAYYTAWLVGVVIFLCCFYALARKIVGNGKLATAMMLYLAILGSVTVWSIIGCANGKFAFLFISVLGGITFIASDSLIGYTMFKKDIKRRDFFIMATYLLAQLLLAGGMLITTCLVA